MADQVATQAETDTSEPEPKPEAKPSFFRTLFDTLWFPVFFFCGFLACYLLAFHAPTPHHVRVAVADPAAATQLQAALDKASPGAFDIVPVTDTDAARQSVLDRDTTAGYSAAGGKPTLFVAKADGYSLESVLTQTFTPIAAKSGGTLITTDVAPTASGDTMGTGLFYLVLVWNIPSYVIVMMLLRAVTLSRRQKVGILVGWAAFLSVAGFFGGLAMSVIPANPLVIPLAFLLSLAISLPAFGLVPFAKQFFPGVAMGLFVLLSMPSSGGAIPVQMVPGFFRALHPFMPMGNMVEAARGVLYFHGVGVWPHVLVMGAWALVGAALIGGHSLWLKRKEARADAAEQEVVAEPPVEDPTFEMPQPTAVPAHFRSFGGFVPVVTGRVAGLDGAPVAGAAVTVTDGHGTQLVRTVTDGAGEYALSGLSAQYVDLVVSAAERRPTVRRIRIREGRTLREDFALEDRRSPLAAVAGA